MSTITKNLTNLRERSEQIALSVSGRVQDRIKDVRVPDYAADRAKRTVYAGVGLAEAAVGRVRDVATVTVPRSVTTSVNASVETAKETFARAVGSMDRARSLMDASRATANSAYADFSKRGEQIVTKLRTETAPADEPAEAPATKAKATAKTTPKATSKATPRSRTAATRKPAPKAEAGSGSKTGTKTVAKTGPKATATR
ncbi:MAG: hypothetical protein ACRCYQ_07210 [Nocardioides sp.]